MTGQMMVTEIVAAARERGLQADIGPLGVDGTQAALVRTPWHDEPVALRDRADLDWVLLELDARTAV